MKYNKYDRILDVIIFSYMITCNIFFGIFVWNKYDLSPNFALASVGFPLIVGLAFRIFSGLNKKQEAGE